MKYVCEYDGNTGFGETLLEAYNDFVANSSYCEFVDCDFYKLEKVEVEMDIRLKY